MKKIILPLLLAVVSALPTHAQTILVVDVNGVFNNLIEVKTTINNINALREKYSDSLTTMGNDLTKLTTEAGTLQTQADNTTNLPAERDAYRTQLTAVSAKIDKAKADMQTFYQQGSNQLTQYQQTLVQEQMAKITTAVKGIADKKKASLVLNSSALGLVTPVIYSDGKTATDITKEVTDELNADATVAAPAAAVGTLPTLNPAPAASSATK